MSSLPVVPPLLPVLSPANGADSDPAAALVPPDAICRWLTICQVARFTPLWPSSLLPDNLLLKLLLLSQLNVAFLLHYLLMRGCLYTILVLWVLNYILKQMLELWLLQLIRGLYTHRS